MIINQLKKMFRPRTDQPTAKEALAYIRKCVESMNINTVRDDFDAGYDMAIEEILDVIADYQKSLSTTVPPST